MIKIILTFNREVMQFVVKNKNIYYTDRVWQNWIRCVPKDETLIRKIKMSRNKLPLQLIKMFSLSKKEQEEYNNAKDDNELSEIIIRDARLKGCKLEKVIKD